MGIAPGTAANRFFIQPLLILIKVIKAPVKLKLTFYLSIV